MKRTPLRRGKPLERGPGPKRTGRVKPVNRKRKDRTWAVNYGTEARVEWINAMPCLCGGKHPACAGRTVNAHTVSKGHRGTAADVVPLSWLCHVWQGDHGWDAWEDAAGLARGTAKRQAAELAAM